MASSRAPIILNAIYTLMAASTTLSTMDVAVWYGGVATGDTRQALFIGYDADPEGDFASIETTQEWAGLGAKKRDENFSVICSIVVLIGEENVKTGVDAAFAILAVVEDILRADPSIGQPPPFVAAVAAPTLYLPATNKGLAARLVFRVNGFTRI